MRQRLGGVDPGRIAGQLAPRSLADPSGRRTRHAGRRGMRVGSAGNRCPCLRSTDQALRWRRLPARSGESPRQVGQTDDPERAGIGTGTAGTWSSRGQIKPAFSNGTERDERLRGSAGI
ncbi:hypothetical protein XFF7767_110009 [Xanthomonas citri pv. fuscans]|nr:hypothetical protein XFF7767_110009 [Xanthomonas citri pv. fuscans]SOO08524.1 hypothetical protein XFF6970_230046 [Xanthomonas citri pv. fuscans]SOO15844.1 hypothetical protein XFF7766_680009 [Xanthomonas citri pv. fuscans]SOO42642.1 hypothetical protein XFF1815_230043 [Xanthomonas citri pv. fuscans]